MSAASSVKRSGETAQFRLKRLKSYTAVDAGEATESTDSQQWPLSEQEPCGSNDAKKLSLSLSHHSTDYAGESQDANQMSLPDADPGAPVSPLRLSDAEANALFGFVDSVDALVGSQSQGSTSTGQKIYTRDEIKKRYDDLMANTNPKNWPFQAINHAIHMYEEIDENPPVELKSLQLDWYYGRRTLADIDFDKLTDTELSLHVI